MRVSRRFTALLVALVAVGLAALPVPAQGGLPAPPPPQLPESPVPSWTDCFQNLAFPGPSGEIYGPTDINAMTANGRLAVGLNRSGTVTVLRYPRPSYYDQVKYRTSSREEERFGALPNEGLFLGLLVRGQGTTWLRDTPVSQRYREEGSDTVEQRYDVAELGLEVIVADTVAAGHDALVRSVDVRVVDPAAVPEAVELIAYENLNLTVGRLPYFPVMDWCAEELNTDRADFDASNDAIVHQVTGFDQAADEVASVALAVGMDRTSSQHQIGGDAFEGTALPAGRPPSPTQDAYLDAADGRLSGNRTYQGQTTGAVTAALDLTGRRDRVSVVVAGGADPAEATRTLAAVRRVTTVRPDTVVREKHRWFRQILRDAPLPASGHPDVQAVARRALVTLASVHDRGSGAIVASIATQSPYGEDWPRDGAFFNHALDLAGRSDWAAERLRWYASLQSDGTPGPTVPGTERSLLVPAGNWAMNYYADGVVGGPIPWEIDETGYMLWAFWDHTDATGDRETLREVYPAVVRAADFLTECVDPRNDLQCVAIEDDNPQPRQSIDGAGPVLLGLRSAVAAAEALGERADADRWSARAQTLAAAVDQHLHDDGVYQNANAVMVWPVCLHPFDDPRYTDRHYEAMWDGLARTFAQPQAGPEGKTRGLYEVKGLLALAKATRDLPGWNKRVRDGLRWIATEHAEPDTHVMGEEWLLEDGEVVSTVSQPHVWEQILFYLAALEAWPPATVDVNNVRDCDGAIGRLRTDHEGRGPGGAPRP